MARQKNNGGRFTVTGLDLSVSYADFGPAFSRTVTEASKQAMLGNDATFYVRDLLGETLAYSESFGETRSVASVGPKGKGYSR